METQSKNKSTDLLEYITEGAVLCDVSGKIRYINSTGLDVIGQDSKNVVGKKYDSIFIHKFRKNSDKNNKLPLYLAFESGHVVQKKTRIKFASGVDDDFNVSIFPLRNKTGSIIGGIQYFCPSSKCNMGQDIDEDMYELLRSHLSQSAWKQLQETAAGRGQATAFQRYLSVVFLDLVNFSTMSEKKKPEEVIDILNSFFTKVDGTVRRYNGDIDKFVGDAMIINFPTPEDAVRCGMEIVINDLNLINDEISAKFKDFDDISVHLGINSGWLIQGNVGSKHRRETTVIGDAVNIAARIQSLTPPNELWITSSTFSGLGQLQRFFTPVDRTKLKGKIKKVMVYSCQYNGIPIEKKVLCYEKKNEIQGLIRNQLSKLKINKVITADNMEQIKRWIGPEDISLVITGPSVLEREVEQIIAILQDYADRDIPIIPILREKYEPEKQKLYEKLGLRVYVPLYDEQAWEKIGSIMRMKEIEDIPRIEKEDFEKEEEITRESDTVKAIAKETSEPESDPGLIRGVSGLPNGVSVQIIENGVKLRFEKKLSIKDMDEVRANVEKAWIYSFGSKNIDFVFDLAYIPSSSIDRSFLKGILSSVDFVSNPSKTKISIVFPPDMPMEEWEKVKKQFKYEFI